jgi:hypothetical protein
MITSAIQYGSQIAIYENGNPIGNVQISGGQFLGHSQNFLLVKYNDLYVTFNEKNHQLGSIPLPADCTIQSITDSGFVARTGNLLIQYDMFCHQRGSTTV